MSTRLVYNVTQPSLTAFLPNSSQSMGTAVIVCPGGAFQTLFIDWEGTEIAQWLTEKGITAFVLKYRTYHLTSGDAFAEMAKNTSDPGFDAIVGPIWNLELEDAKAAISYLRLHAAEYKINPRKIGIMGFSAGGSVAAMLARNYTPATRPDFAASLYAYIADSMTKAGVPKDGPPLFIAAATDDELVPVSNSVRLYNDWISVKRPAELHLFSKGGHGFSLRRKDLPVYQWTELFMQWLNTQLLPN